MTTNYLSYLTSLSDEELLARIKDPSSTEQRDAVNTLLNRYKSEVRFLSRTYFLIGSDQQDLLQEGMIGLYHAVQSYQESIGLFRPFARTCITRQLISALRVSLREKNIPLNQAISLDQMTRDEEGEEHSMLDLLPDSSGLSPEDSAIQFEEESLLLDKFHSVLSKLESQVLDLYLTGMNYHEIADSLQISSKSADNALSRIRKKIGKLFS